MSLEQLSLKLRFPFIIRVTGLLSIILSIFLFFVLPRFTGETVQEHYDQIIIEQIDIPQTQQIERPPPPARPSIPIESEDEDLADDLTISNTRQTKTVTRGVEWGNIACQYNSSCPALKRWFVLEFQTDVYKTRE